MQIATRRLHCFAFQTRLSHTVVYLCKLNTNILHTRIEARNTAAFSSPLTAGSYPVPTVLPTPYPDECEL